MSAPNYETQIDFLNRFIAKKPPILKILICDSPTLSRLVLESTIGGFVPRIFRAPHELPSQSSFFSPPDAQGVDIFESRDCYEPEELITRAKARLYPHRHDNNMYSIFLARHYSIDSYYNSVKLADPINLENAYWLSVMIRDLEL